MCCPTKARWRVCLRPPEMNKPWKVVLVFVGVFIAGAICGGPLVGRWLQPERDGSHGRFRLQLMQRLEDELGLNDEQKIKIRPIVQRAQEETQRLRRENVKAIAAAMDQMHAQIAAELTAEQKVKLEDMRKRFRERAERVRSEFRDRPAPPPEDGAAPGEPPAEPKK